MAINHQEQRVKSPKVHLYIRVLTAAGGSVFAEPVWNKNRTLRAGYAEVDAKHHPEGIYYLRFRRGGKSVWEAVGPEPGWQVGRHGVSTGQFATSDLRRNRSGGPDSRSHTRKRPVARWLLPVPGSPTKSARARRVRDLRLRPGRECRPPGCAATARSRTLPAS